MKVIVCLENRGGMSFFGKRLSRDRKVTEKICEICKGRPLWIHPYSEMLFAQQKDTEMVLLQKDEQFLQKAQKGEYCFVEKEKLVPYRDSIEQLIIFWWNRDYPADQKLDLSLSDWKLKSAEEFSGFSHEKIRKEVYEK